MKTLSLFEFWRKSKVNRGRKFVKNGTKIVWFSCLSMIELSYKYFNATSDNFWPLLMKPSENQAAKLFLEFDSQSILPNIDIEIWDNLILISQYVVSILISHILTFGIPLQSASLTKFRMENWTILKKFLSFKSTPTPWLTLLLVLGKSRAKQNLC